VQGPLPLESASELNPAQPAGDSFSNVLGRMVEEVNAKQTTAADAVSALQSGQNVPLHQAVIAMEEANVSFQLMVEVRNHLLDSYQELMRMQI
jgi:flagellar hook-basal body complex protein FliE